MNNIQRKGIGKMKIYNESDSMYTDINDVLCTNASQCICG